MSFKRTKIIWILNEQKLFEFFTVNKYLNLSFIFKKRILLDFYILELFTILIFSPKKKSEFFKDFFQDGGKYMKFVSLVNNGAIDAGDRIKIGKEYKIGIVVSVNVAALRKDLEDAGIIKSLSNGF